MKRVTLEATDENILEAIKTDALNRASDICSFIEALDDIEGNMFISLDAGWGEGKTFFVRQVETTLEYLTKRTWEAEDKNDKFNELEPYFENSKLNSIDLKKSYLPIYYNAWLYDNHNDPLMSLVFEIIRKSEFYFDIKISDQVGNPIEQLLSALSINAGPVSFSLQGIKEMKGTDILQSVRMAEEIRDIVKKILDEAIIEKAQRLVIFIDELDRCRPNYAIEMLERIKHYFDDERIIFVVSVNKAQLVHTISNCYGYGFDSTGYLNKFFDLNAHLPLLTEDNKRDLHIHIYNSEQRLLMMIINDLIDYYKLSLRDVLIFKQRMEKISMNVANGFSQEGKCLSLFIPIITVLDITNQEEKKKFINGNSRILETICRQVPAIRRMLEGFIRVGVNEDAFEIALRELIKIYENTFKESDNEVSSDYIGAMSSDLKRICINACNGFKS